MSYLVNEEIPCTYCQFPNSVELWSILNVKEDPELKELLLGGELNMAECTACKKIFYAEHFILYHDPEAELMAFVYPLAFHSDRPTYEAKTKIDFEKSQENSTLLVRVGYRPITMFGLDELVRLLEAEDEASIQGEIVNELAKSLPISVIKLKPALARYQNLPPVLPFVKDSNLRDPSSLLKAIGIIEKENNQLSVYTQLGQKISQNPSQGIQFE